MEISFGKEMYAMGAVLTSIKLRAKTATKYTQNTHICNHTHRQYHYQVQSCVCCVAPSTYNLPSTEEAGLHVIMTLYQNQRFPTCSCKLCSHQHSSRNFNWETFFLKVLIQLIQPSVLNNQGYFTIAKVSCLMGKVLHYTVNAQYFLLSHCDGHSHTW